MKMDTQVGEQPLHISQNTNATTCFETLYKRYVGKVYQMCFSITKDSEAAQDFTQDIFIKVFDKFETFQNRSTFSTWLYSISHHYCLDKIRQNKRFIRVTLSDVIDNVVEDQSECIDSQLNTLKIALTSLPAEEIALLRLKYEQGLSIKELAQIYFLSESAVKMRLKRTRDKLHLLYISCDY